MSPNGYGEAHTHTHMNKDIKNRIENYRKTSENALKKQT